MMGGYRDRPLLGQYTFPNSLDGNPQNYGRRFSILCRMSNRHAWPPNRKTAFAVSLMGAVVGEVGTIFVYRNR